MGKNITMGKYQLFDGTGTVIESIDYGAPVVDIALEKSKKNEQINQWRVAANSSTFTHAGKTFSCSDLSKWDVNLVAGSIALTNDFPANFPMQWKAIDNSYLQLADVDAFKAFYASMVAQGTLNFIRSEQLKAALSAATTQTEIDAIVW